VTVLFADVKGSMELAESVDPEEWHRILDRFFAILADGVHRFEGTVNQYTGDGIMALFGAPIAHEDHAQRACYAALHLKDELRRYAEDLKRSRGLSFLVRMGLNSGEVVVGRIGDDLRMDYTAQGQTVGLAARMEQLAAPGEIYLSEHCAKLVSGFFRLRDLGPFDLKGVGAPIRVYELEGVSALHTRIEVSRSRGFSRFVGRSDGYALPSASVPKNVAEEIVHRFFRRSFLSLWRIDDRDGCELKHGCDPRPVVVHIDRRSTDEIADPLRLSRANERWSSLFPKAMEVPAMGKCEICGNDYDKAFQIKTAGHSPPHVFDSFECAIHALAPACGHCGCTILGHGVEADGMVYCCAHCAAASGVASLRDRADMPSGEEGRPMGAGRSETQMQPRRLEIRRGAAGAGRRAVGISRQPPGAEREDQEELPPRGSTPR
jgi:class 3 adenylate cyclase